MRCTRRLVGLTATRLSWCRSARGIGWWGSVSGAAAVSAAATPAAATATTTATTSAALPLRAIRTVGSIATRSVEARIATLRAALAAGGEERLAHGLRTV